MFLAAIVSYNNVSLLRNCVKSMRAQNVPLKIAVWDNNSDDETKRYIETSPDIDHYVLSDENVYWTPAINALIERFGEGATYVGCMNNDITLHPGALERLQVLLDRPEVGLVAPATSNMGGPQDVVNCTTHEALLTKGRKYIPEVIAQLEPKRVTFITGACMWMRKDVFDLVGPLDESMPLGADDHDYCMRAKEKDLQVWVAQNVLASHVGHASGKVAGARQIWDDVGGRSWAVFNDRWAGYYADEDEASRCHWGGTYYTGWDKGTGWLSTEEREAERERRQLAGGGRPT